MNNTKKLLFNCSVFFLAVLMTVNISAAEKINVKVSEKASLALQISSKAATGQMLENNKSRNLVVDKNLKKSLLTAAIAYSIGNQALEIEGQTYFLIVTQKMSRELQGKGFCGAGTEDVLRLVQLDKKHKRLVQTDELLIQSCLNNIEIYNDNGQPLRALLTTSADLANPITLRWLSHPKFGDEYRTISIESGKLVVR